MVIGVLKIELYLNGNRSLKDKRQVLKSIFGKVRSRFNNVSISEVDSHDLWQKATIGISLVSNDTRYVNSVLDQVTGFMESNGALELGNREFEIIHF